jgi:hypothetical protein
VTESLALNKGLPLCDYLQGFDIAGPAACPLEFTYDEGWLTITRPYHILTRPSADGLVSRSRATAEAVGSGAAT